MKMLRIFGSSGFGRFAGWGSEGDFGVGVRRATLLPVGEYRKEFE